MAEDEELEAIQREVGRVLSDPAWEVTYNTSTNPRYLSVQVHHPLTSHVNLVFKRASPANAVRLRNFLRSREVELIARAPSRRELIGSVRCNAAIGEWSEGVLDQVATILYAHEIISRAEWEWLHEAGAVDWDADLLGNRESGV
jgi:hypothetical protein